MIRATNRKLAEVVRLAKISDPAVVIAVVGDAVGNDKSLKFLGCVTVGGVAYRLCTDAGKEKVFSTADDLIRFVSSAAPIGSGSYSVVLNTGILLAASVAADQVKAMAARVVKLAGVKTKQQGVIAGLDEQLALMPGWNVGSALQVARFDEVTAQKATVNADIAAIDAEVLRITP